MSESKRKEYAAAKYAAAAVGILLMVWFQWDVAAVITPLLMFAYWLLILALVVTMLVCAIICAVKKRAGKFACRWAPLMIVAALVGILFTAPLTAWYVELDYLTKTRGRAEMVRLFEAAGEAAFAGHTGGSCYRLPPQYANLSKGGEVSVDMTDGGYNILFYTFHGILDNYSGYIYFSEDSAAAAKAFLQYEGERNIHEFVKKQPHWYWVSSS